MPKQFAIYAVLAIVGISLAIGGLFIYQQHNAKVADLEQRQQQAIEEQKREFAAKRAKERAEIEKRTQRMAELEQQEDSRKAAIEAQQKENLNANIDQLENAYRHSAIRSEKERRNAETWELLENSAKESAEFWDDRYWDDDVHGAHARDCLRRSLERKKDAKVYSKYRQDHEDNLWHEKYKLHTNQDALEKARKTQQSLSK